MPRSRNGKLWGVLGGLLGVGMASLALTVGAIGEIVNGLNPYLYGFLAVAGLGVFLFSVLLTMGMIYRVDRLNRDVDRRVRWFE